MPIFRNVSIGTRIGGSIITMLIVLISIVVWTLLHVMSGLIDQAEHEALDNQYKAILNAINNEAYRATTLATFVAAMPISIQGMAAGGNRDALYNAFEPSFKALAASKIGGGLEQFQFHKPPATSFLRIHAKDKFGDDLSSFRATVVEANAQHKVITGLEFGVAGLGIRAVVPVVGNNHLGTIEFGASFGQPFLDRMKSTYGIDLSLFVLKNREPTPFASTIGGVAISPRADLLATFRGKTHTSKASVAGIPRAILVAPVTDYSGNPFAALEVIMDASAHEAHFRKALNTAVAVGALALAVGFGVSVLIHRMAVKPVVEMTSTMQQMASGDFSVTIPSTQGTNEVSSMARAMTVFRDNGLKVEGLQRQNAEQRKKNEEEQRAAMLRLADDLEGKVKTLITQVLDSTGQIVISAEAMGHRMDSGTSRSLEAVSAAQGASDKIAEVAQSSASVVLGMHDVTTGVQRAADAASKAEADA
ncbi:MAG: HAMP domain-containing protein, partial [Alphaproteobacteria bacterium]|nr:HAMP domain-containing protein [Alphaproteobacteria bacterium]